MSVSASKNISVAEREVRIPLPGGGFVSGTLGSLSDAAGLVIFAHGSGSSRYSNRNLFVAGEMHQSGFATLVFDLLTTSEEADDLGTRRFRFDIALLAQRLVLATGWARGHGDLRDLPIGYFGASTGSAAALIAAAQLGPDIGAVVSRGGRPDLAYEELSRVTAPTLLIVGGADTEVVALNRDAYARLRCIHGLEIVRGATHLFEEPGALQRVAVLARNWFRAHLIASSKTQP
jgi:alpha-beta hydrolase superfamily lysophospholipase